MRMLSFLLFLILSFSFSSCGPKASGTGDAGAAIINVENVNGALDVAKNSVRGIVPDTSSVSFTSLQLDVSSLVTTWTNSNYALSMADFGQSPKGFIQKHGNKSAQSSLMYRLDQALSNLCIFSTALPTTGDEIDLNDAGTTTLTAALKSTITNKCNTSVSDMPDGTVVGFKSEDISKNSGTKFKRKISFDVDGNSTYNQYNSYFYYTIEDNTFKFLFVEDSQNDSAVYFDFRNNVFRFEFSEFAPSNFVAHYRGTLNKSSKNAFFAAYVTDNTDTAKAVVATIENSSGEMAVSYSFDDGDGANDLADFNNCVASSTLALSTESTLTCSGVTGKAASSWTTDLSGISASYITGLDESTFMNFSGPSDILTAAKGN